MKPYQTAKLLKIYLKEHNKTQIRFFCETPFDSKVHQDNLKYLSEIKVLKTDEDFSFYKPTKYFDFYLIFRISPHQLFSLYHFMK